MFPGGAPLPGAPPCILQRVLPRTLGDRHGLPLRVRAPHRDAWLTLCTGLFRVWLWCPTRLVNRTDDGLSAVINVNVFNRDLLLALAAIAI